MLMVARQNLGLAEAETPGFSRFFFVCFVFCPFPILHYQLPQEDSLLCSNVYVPLSLIVSLIRVAAKLYATKIVEKKAEKRDRSQQSGDGVINPPLMNPTKPAIIK